MLNLALSFALGIGQVLAAVPCPSDDSEPALNFVS